MNKLIGFEEVAELTTIPESTIRRMVTGGRIPCIRFGKQVRFDPDDIAAWIEGSGMFFVSKDGVMGLIGGGVNEPYCSPRALSRASHPSCATK